MLAAALTRGVAPRWCAAIGGLAVLLRCLGLRWGWSSKGPRPGGWRRRWSGVSGCGLGTGWTHDAAFVHWGSRMLRLLRDPVVNAEAFDLRRRKAESWAPFALGRRRDFRAASPLSVDLQPQNGSCGCRSTDRTRERRTVGQERRNEEPCVEGKLRPDPETRSRPQARCRSRPFRKPTPAPAEAAHQQPQASAGCASANPDPLRQPDRRTQPSWRRAPARRASARTVSRSSPVTVTCPTLRPGFTPLP